MENRLYRQESIDQVNSQEQIRDYLRVTSPRIWMMIVAVAALIAGFLAYASEAGEEITVPVTLEVSNVQNSEKRMIEASFEISKSDRDNYSTGMEVRFAGVSGKICYFIETEEMTMVNAWVDDPKAQVPDGRYEGVVVVETSTPISELLQ